MYESLTTDQRRRCIEDSASGVRVRIERGAQVRAALKGALLDAPMAILPDGRTIEVSWPLAMRATYADATIRLG